MTSCLASITLFLVIALAQAGGDQPKNWRGIIPLRSTRADVERLLGPPPPPPRDGTMLYTPGKASSRYFLEGEDVRIAYMTDEFAERKSCSSFPIDTVIGVRVFPKEPPPLTGMLSDLRMDENKFVTLDPSTPPNIGFKAYVNIDDGVFICTLAGKVRDMGYYGDVRDRQACPALNEDRRRMTRP